MPIIDDPRPFKHLDNATFLNRLRNDATPTYQERVPEATKGNLEQVQDYIFSAPGIRNEFVNSLFNVAVKIARGTSFSNPLKKYKREQLAYGDRIEQTQIGLAQAYVYDTDRDYLERILFGRETPETMTAIHRISRQEFYKVTVDMTLLKRAFYQDEGLSNFSAELLRAQATSDEVDEFEQMISMFRQYYDRAGFWVVNVPDVTDLDSTTAQAKALTRRVRALATSLRFVDRRYNAARMPVATTAEKLVLYITPEAQAAVDVEALAAAFNTSYADMPFRTEVVPQEKLNIPGVQAILTTEDFLMVADTLYDTTSQDNAAAPGMVNYFLHHHEIISVNPFVPAILFSSTDADSTLEGDVPPSESVVFDGIFKPAEAETPLDPTAPLEHATLYQLKAHTEPDDRIGVKWEIVEEHSSFTYITNTGTLYIGEDETLTTITVRAIALDNDENVVEQAFTIDDVPVDYWPREGETVPPAPAPAWTADTAYAVGDSVTLSTGETLTVTVAGTSGATEPAAPATVGETVTDGTVTWERTA